VAENIIFTIENGTSFFVLLYPNFEIIRKPPIEVNSNPDSIERCDEVTNPSIPYIS